MFFRYVYPKPAMAIWNYADYDACKTYLTALYQDREAVLDCLLRHVSQSGRKSHSDFHFDWDSSCLPDNQVAIDAINEAVEEGSILELDERKCFKLSAAYLSMQESMGKDFKMSFIDYADVADLVQSWRSKGKLR